MANKTGVVEVGGPEQWNSTPVDGKGHGRISLEALGLEIPGQKKQPSNVEQRGL